MAEIINGDKISTIAFYLPQYHSIPENDKAWGKDFTEWTNVKKAKPLYDGHYQPREPLDDRYYNLLNAEEQEWQAELAEKYGIFGFCYYHYWFKDGKMLLEKPAENMLENRDIKLPFCFSWANENWSKRWDGGNEELIVEQDYGTESDWKKHLDYLIPFFKDDRYITVDGKPLFLIYKPEEIEHIDDMLRFFKSEIKKYGFEDLCLMIQNSTSYFSPRYKMGLFNYQVKFQPFFGVSNKEKDLEKAIRRRNLYAIIERLHLKKMYMLISRIKHKVERTKANNELQIMNYSDIWESIIASKTDPKLVEGAYTDWDNTPRRANGRVFQGASPELFEKYMRSLRVKVRDNHVLPIIFINAWNEWGEGAYLEPDKKFGFKYLEALKKSESICD